MANSPKVRKKSGEQIQSAPKKPTKTKALRTVAIKKAICKRKLQEINENKKRALLGSKDKDLVDEEEDEKNREAKQAELSASIEELEKKYEETEEQKHKLFMLLKYVLAEDEKKKQQEMQEKKLLEQKRAEEAAQLALTQPKEDQQRRPNYYTHGHDPYARGPTTPPHQFLSNPRKNMGGMKPMNQPFTSLVPPALQHLTAQQHHFNRRREPPLLKDPPHPFFGSGFIGDHTGLLDPPLLQGPLHPYFGPGFGANPHLAPMALPRMLPQVQAQALAMQIQQGLGLPQLLHNSFANPHMRLARDPRNHPSQRGRVYW